MKKLTVVLFMVALIISCKKEEPTTYQIVNNSEVTSSTIPYLDGSMYEVVVFHYSGEDITKQDNIKKIEPAGGKSEIIEVPASTEKLKVSFKFLPPESSFYDSDANNRKYVVAFSIITKEKNNLITVDGNTMIKETISKSENPGLSSIKWIDRIRSAQN